MILRSFVRVVHVLFFLLALEYGVGCVVRNGQFSSRPCYGEISCSSDVNDVLIVSTSLLQKDNDFETIVDEYKRVLEVEEELCAEYIEVDSQECLFSFGTKVNNPGDWEEIRSVLAFMVDFSGASYILILGGVSVFPSPTVTIPCPGEDTKTITSDAWYVDFDNDYIVDEGLSIGRLPDLKDQSSAVVASLRTATSLHRVGGFALDVETRFSVYDYTTPPYGVCDDCTMREPFFDLMSASNFIWFTGHGSPAGFYNNSVEPIFTLNYMDAIDLQMHHPVIIGYYSCNTARLLSEIPTLAYAFPKAGAAGFIARTTDLGVPSYVAAYFPSQIEDSVPIGLALFRAMRESVLIGGCRFKASAGHLSLYGDPTLKRRSSDNPPP